MQWRDDSGKVVLVAAKAFNKDIAKDVKASVMTLTA